MGADLGGKWQQPSEASNQCMDGDIKPTPQCIIGRVFPCLQTISSTHIMCWLPVVESLIAVLYGRIEGCEQIDCEKYVESADGLDCEGSGRPRNWLVRVLLGGVVVSIYFVFGTFAGGVPAGGVPAGRLVVAVLGGILNRYGTVICR